MLQAEQGIDACDPVHDLRRATAQSRPLKQRVVVGWATLAAATARGGPYVDFEVGEKASTSFLTGPCNVHVARVRDEDFVRLTRGRHARSIALQDGQVVLWKTKQAG